MARIRSIHPPIWTDETFAALTDSASLLLIGLWTEADDNGVFEWKPVTLKMRLRPVKNETLTELSGLLDELVAANVLQQFEVEGRLYGAIRNFLRWQRPKQRKAAYPLPDFLSTYVGFSSEGLIPRSGTGRPPVSPGYEGPTASDSQTSEAKPRSKQRTSEVVPNDFGSGSELGCQRKEEGGRRKEGRGKREEEGVKDDAGNSVASEVEDLPDDFTTLMLSVRSSTSTDSIVADTTAPTPAEKVPPIASVDPKPEEEEYVFEAGPIRLLAKDLKRLQETYPSINVRGRLQSMSDWDALRGSKGWWGPANGALMKAEEKAAKEIREAQIRADADAKAGINKAQRAGRPAI